MRFIRLMIVATAIAAPLDSAAGSVEFCLDGQFDLGARYQGMQPRAGEISPARWCVVTEDRSERVLLSMRGKSNPDMEGGWSVSFLPPDRVRIVNAESPPDIEFAVADSRNEARRNRRMDPRRVVEELTLHPEWIVGRSENGRDIVRYPGESARVEVEIRDGRLMSLQSTADLPLRGRVAVVWRWRWPDDTAPELSLEVDGEIFFKARGAWRTIDDVAGAKLWRPTQGVDPQKVPGENWPARIDMHLVELADGVHLVRTVRTGFQHLVVSTDAGLVVADAPTGWVELHQIPPADLVPGLGVSGLSEAFVDFLRAEFPDQQISAVALTHAHDDHAGGARAFAAAGAAVYAPVEIAGFLQSALNRDSMPADRLRSAGGRVRVLPVAKSLVLADASRPVELLPIGAGPHAVASLGIHVVEQGIFFQSDLHVPNSEADMPRMDRAITECWFAEWAVANLPPDVLVVNSHRIVQTPVSRLAKYLDSEICLGAVLEP